jgi:hypothetical protein
MAHDYYVGSLVMIASSFASDSTRSWAPYSTSASYANSLPSLVHY